MCCGSVVVEKPNAPAVTASRSSAAIFAVSSGHAVPTGAGHQRVPADLSIVMSMRIDKARRDDEIGSIDGLRRRTRDLADLSNPASIDRNITASRRGASAVKDSAVLD